MKTTRTPFDPAIPAAVLLGLLLFSPFLARGIPNTADGMLHLYRGALWMDAWREGVLWPRWHTSLYAGFGYPLFNFYAPLLYFGTSILGLLLPSAELALKGVLLIACIAYPLGMYLWLRELLGRLPALVAATAFALAAYRFRELFVQGNYAQFLAWGLAPWVLYTWRRLAMAPGRGLFLAAVASLTALLLAHNISAMLLAPLAALYVLWQALEHRASKPWPRLLLAAGCSILISLAFWMPALLESGDTNVEVLTQGYFNVAEHFISLEELVAATPAIDGRAANPTLPYNVGRLPLLLALLGALNLARPGLGRDRRGHLLFALIAGLTAAFLMLPQSLVVWRTVPYIAFAEFPTRLYSILSLCVALLAGASVVLLDRWLRPQALAALLAIFALILGVANLQLPRPFLPVQASAAGLLGYEADYNAPGTTSASEYLSRWTSALPPIQALTREGERVALVEPPAGMQGTVESVTATSLTLRVRAQEAGVAPIAQFYAPGWSALLNGNPVDLSPCTPAGLTCVPVPSSDSTLALRYVGTRTQQTAGVLGIVGLVATLLVLAVGVGRRLPGAPQTVTSPARGPLLAPAALLAVILVAKVFWVAPHTTLFRFSSPAGAVVPAQHQANLPMGPSVRLLGWDLPSEVVRQGETLRVRLYWQATEPLQDEYTSFVQLIDGAEQREFGSSTNMHAGSMPTRSWNTDYYVIDEHEIRVGADVPVALYALRVGLSPRDSQERIGEQDLTPRVRIEPAQPVREQEVEQHVEAEFVGGEALLGYTMARDGDVIQLILYWRGAETPAPQRQVLVHMIDQSGSQIAQFDGAANNGLYPVGDWLPGEIVADHRQIVVPPGAEAAALLVGLYGLDTGERSAVVDQDGLPLADNAVRIELAAE